MAAIWMDVKRTELRPEALELNGVKEALRQFALV